MVIALPVRIAVHPSHMTHDSMRRAYSAQSTAGVGPRRVAVPSGRQVADMDDVLSGCAAATKRWERALTLLAQ